MFYQITSGENIKGEISLNSLNNTELARLLFSISLLLLFSHMIGYLFHKLKLPRVIGEITGGIILGPSCLGFFFPDVYHLIFNTLEVNGKILSFVYWLGLILLMLISGFEIESSKNSEDKKLLTALLIGATIVPFMCGWFAPNFYNFSQFYGTSRNAIALKLIIAIFVTITAIPVISKMFLDLGIMNTRFAKIVLTVATIHDVILWIAISIATGLVDKNGFTFKDILTTILVTIIFFMVSLLIIPYFFRKITLSKYNILYKSNYTGYIMFICLFFTSITSFLNVNIIFGAFLAGIIIKTLKDEKITLIKNNIRDFSLAFFVPIYFSIVGIQVDLIHHFNIWFCIGFLIFASLAQMLGTFIFVKLLKFDNFTCFNFAVALNGRGGVGIVLATIAFNTGIINETFFSTLVVISILTSLFCGYWFKLIISKRPDLIKHR